jgi:hypothetical protein
MKYLHIKPFDIKLYAAYKDMDIDSYLKLNSKIYMIRRDMLSIEANYKKGRNSYTFISNYSHNFLYKYKFYRFLNEILYSYQLHFNLFYTFYAKKVIYSNYLDSFTEIGGNIFFGNMDNLSKKWDYFINPSFAYNSLSKTTYQIIFGINKRVIKADNLRFVVIYGKDMEGIKIVYIYYY